MRKALCFSLLIAGVTAGGEATALSLDGIFTQGGLVQGRTAAECVVALDGKPVRVATDGRFVIGFGWDHGPDAELRVSCPGKAPEVRALEIAARQYKTQRIDGLPPAMVTPPKAVLERIRRENARIADVRAQDSPYSHFAEAFAWPVHGTVTGVFGSRRILNGKPRRPHFGIDIAAPAGTLVMAPAGGRVAMAEAELYYTGGTVMLDHGHGLTSVYSHLAKVSVQVGQVVKRGDLLGTVGASGRATGPHLDWRINWFAERLDPALLVGPMSAD